MNTFQWLFIAGLIFILCGFCFISLSYKVYKELEKKENISFYSVGVTDSMPFFHGGFWFTTYSLSKILHQWWQHRITYLIVMIYAILVYFAYQYIIKKFKVNDIINYSFSKGISYIYLIVALYQFYRFLTYG